MNTLARRIATLVAALALAATATGCTNTPTATPTADTADSQAALDALNNASEITATKSLLSWGDEWGIEADGNKVGTVTGQAPSTQSATFTPWSPRAAILSPLRVRTSSRSRTRPPSTTGTTRKPDGWKNASSRSRPL